jgi:hypothetical protein
MSPKERYEIIEFLLQSQSNAAERHQEAMNRMDEFSHELAALAAITRDLVEVARLHSKRLDRLDNLNP